MPYISPELDVLLKHIPSSLEAKPHQELADQLTVILQLISSQEKRDKETLSQVVGANIYFYELIGPEIKGYFYNSSSALYSFIGTGLNLSAKNTLSERDKLIALNKFYKFITDNSVQLAPLLKSITIDELQKKIKKVLSGLLDAIPYEISKIARAIPTEQSIKQHMKKLPEEYKKIKTAQNNSWLGLLFSYINKNHVLLTQLALLVGSIECDDDKQLSPDTMTRSQRITLGLLLYMTATIEATYWVRSAYNSTLYTMCKEILNSELDAAQALACLSAFRSFINSHEERGKLEIAARDYFQKDNLLVNIDAELVPICNKLLEMEAALEKNANTTNWPATKAMSAAGVILGSAGYGLGSALGYAISETEVTNAAKTSVGVAATSMATAIFQSTSAGYFAFAVGDFIIKCTLTRAFAKIFEFVAIAMGGLAGGAIGFTFDLSYKGLREISKRLLNYCDEHPEQMRNVDREFVQCLLELPHDLFPAVQDQIRYAKGVDAPQKLALTN